MILYHTSNLVYTIFFPQFLIFQQNNSAQTLVLIFFTSRHYYFFEKIKIVEKQLYKLNCSYDKVSHTLNRAEILGINKKYIGPLLSGIKNNKNFYNFWNLLFSKLKFKNTRQRYTDVLYYFWKFLLCKIVGI